MENDLPICPTYAFLQSGHVSLYTPDFLYSSLCVWFCAESSLLIVLRVVYVTLTEVFLNNFVMNLVSFPK
jgi:hypothetical protein